VASLAPPAGSCEPGGGEVEGTVEKVRELALGEYTILVSYRFFGSWRSPKSIVYRIAQKGGHREASKFLNHFVSHCVEHFRVDRLAILIS